MLNIFNREFPLCNEHNSNSNMLLIKKNLEIENQSLNGTLLETFMRP